MIHGSVDRNVVMNGFHTGNGTHGLQEELKRGVGVFGETVNLDSQKGDLGEEALEVDGFRKETLLLRREGGGVEAVPAGVLVAEGCAAFASREYGPGW